MNNDKRDWVFGFIIFLLFSTTLWYINTLVNPYGHFTWLEWYGIFMLFITFKTGVDTFREQEEE